MKHRTLIIIGNEIQDINLFFYTFLFYSTGKKECICVCTRCFTPLHFTNNFSYKIYIIQGVLKRKLWCRGQRGWLKHFLSQHILLADIWNVDTRYPYDIFPRHLPAWLNSVLHFHHNWATCLKVCLKPMTGLSRSLQYIQRITANKVAPKLRAPRSKASVDVSPPSLSLFTFLYI